MEVKINEILNQIMHEREWTQSELALHYGVSKSQVSRWLSGVQKPCLDVYIMLKSDYDSIVNNKAI